MFEPEKFPVQLRLTLAILGTFYLVLIAMVFWLGAPEQNEATADSAYVSSAATPSASAPAEATLSVQTAPATESSPSPIKKIELSPEQRQLVLGEIVKAADKDMLRVRSDIAKARTEGASTTEIAVKEEKLRNMQAVLQQVQSKNRPAE